MRSSICSARWQKIPRRRKRRWPPPYSVPPRPSISIWAPLVGFYGKVAAMLDDAAEMPGVKGIMLTFDDFLAGMDDYGRRIQPLMRCRKPMPTGRRHPRVNIGAICCDLDTQGFQDTQLLVLNVSR